MSETKFTPGPWAYEASPTSSNTTEFEIGPVRDDGRIDWSWEVCMTTSQNEADARLIAAAPDLYEALRELCDRVGPRWFLEQNWSAPLDALAKATAA